MDERDYKALNESRGKKKLAAAVAYGMGYVCGKHNLKLPQKEIKEVTKNIVKELESWKTK